MPKETIASLKKSLSESQADVERLRRQLKTSKLNEDSWRKLDGDSRNSLAESQEMVVRLFGFSAMAAERATEGLLATDPKEHLVEIRKSAKELFSDKKVFDAIRHSENLCGSWMSPLLMGGLLVAALPWLISKFSAAASVGQAVSVATAGTAAAGGAAK